MIVRRCGRLLVMLAVVAAAVPPLAAQDKWKVIIDQDRACPGGTDMQAVLAIVNSPKADEAGHHRDDRRCMAATRKCSTRCGCWKS